MSDDSSDGHLAPLPRRVLEAPAGGGSPAPVLAPIEFSHQLIERADLLLATLAKDVSHLRSDQEEAIARIEADWRRQQADAEVAEATLQALLTEGREVAQRKTKVDLLQQGLRASIDPRNVRDLPSIVTELHVELRAAQGITGAIRIEAIGRLLLEANLRVELIKLSADKAREALIEVTERDLVKESTEAGASFDIGRSLLVRDLDVLRAGLSAPARPWDDVAWTEWAPPEQPHGVVRAGSLQRAGMDDLALPWLLEMPGMAGVSFSPGTHRDEATSVAQSIVLRSLAALPAGALRLSLVDPVGLGANFAPFLALAEHDPQLVDGAVATSAEDVGAMLARLSSHIERVIRQYLRGRYEDLAECNRAAGEVLEPYRTLVVADYPSAFSEDDQELLRRIVEHGPAAGVSLLILRDPAYKPRFGGARQGSIPGLVPVTANADGLLVDLGLEGSWTLLPDAMPDTADGPGLVERIIVGIGEGSRAAHRGGVTVDSAWRLLADARADGIRSDLPRSRLDVDPADSTTWWTGDPTALLAAPIGRAGVRDAAVLPLDSRERGSALVVGQPGSGVSTALTTLVAGWCMQYPPSSVELHLVAIGERSTFAPAATSGLPHAKLVADHAERELVIALLERLVQRLEPSAQDDDDEDEDDDDAPGRARVVVVLDGVEELLGPEDQISRRARGLLEQVLQDGPEAGMHLVLGLRADESTERQVSRLNRTLDRLPLDTIGTRLVLTCSESLFNRLAATTTDGADEDEQPSRPGDAVMATGPAGGARPRPVRLTLVTARDRYRLLRSLRDLATSRKINARPQIHDGTAPARLELSPLHRLLQNADQRQQRRQPRLWLGEPATLGEPVEVLLGHQEGANLLIVSPDSEAGVGMLLSALTSAILVHGANLDARVLDFTPLESGMTEAIQAFAGHWPVQAERRRNLDKVLDSVHLVVQDRLSGSAGEHGPMLLVLAGLDRARDLDASDPEGARMIGVLDAILGDGPEVGVHVLAWTSSVEGLERRAGPGALREFALRVATSLTEEESTVLFDGPVAAELRDHQAVLHDEDWGRVTRFRPYMRPPTAWLQGLARAAAGVGADG